MSTKAYDITEQLKQLQEQLTEGLVIDESEIEITMSFIKPSSPRRLKRVTMYSSQIEKLKELGAIDAAKKYEAKKYEAKKI